MSPAELDQSVERFKQACRKAGVKLTHQRLEIFREVASVTSHPDAETVFQGVKRRVPTVSLDTVYRTLWTLTEVGLLTTLGPRRERVRFDANLSPHHHFVCVRCGLARDFASPDLDALRTPLAAMEFGTVLDTRLEVRGICSTCSARATASAPARDQDAQRSSAFQR